jgi:hypothetical protein
MFLRIGNVEDVRERIPVTISMPLILHLFGHPSRYRRAEYALEKGQCVIDAGRYTYVSSLVSTYYKVVLESRLV